MTDNGYNGKVIYVYNFLKLFLNIQLSYPESGFQGTFAQSAWLSEAFCPEVWLSGAFIILICCIIILIFELWCFFFN